MRKAKTDTVSMTLAEIRNRKIPRSELGRMRKLAALRDDQIDTTDVPQSTRLTGGIRGRFYRPETQTVTVSLTGPDVEAARRLSEIKGMPYQTYLKGLLHEALARETMSIQGAGSKPEMRR